MKCLTSTTIFPALKKGIGYFIFDFLLYDFSWMGNAESGRWLSLYWGWRPQDQKDEFYPKPCLQSQTHLGKAGPLSYLKSLVQLHVPVSKDQLQRLNQFALGIFWSSFKDLWGWAPQPLVPLTLAQIFSLLVQSSDEKCPNASQCPGIVMEGDLGCTVASTVMGEVASERKIYRPELFEAFRLCPQQGHE